MQLLSALVAIKISMHMAFELVMMMYTRTDVYFFNRQCIGLDLKCEYPPAGKVLDENTVWKAEGYKLVTRSSLRSIAFITETNYRYPQ